MVTYSMKKLGAMLMTLIGITIIGFILGVMSPSDPAVVALTMDGGTAPTVADIEQKRRELGLERPLYAQYGAWLYQLLHGNWGASYITGDSVFHKLLSRSAVTFQLALITIAMIGIGGIAFGSWMGMMKEGRTYRVMQSIAVLGTTTPAFWSALVAVYWLSETYHIFPSHGYETVRHLLLPAIVLSISSLCLLARLQSDSLRRVLAENYILLAKAKGFPFWYVVYHHGIKNAVIPIVTLLGNYFVGILGGSIIVESIFALPGLGSLVLEAVSARDYPMIQGYVVLVGCTTIVVNQLVDLVSLWLQPKLTVAMKGGHHE